MIYSMKELLENAYENHYGIPAFNFENFDVLEGIFLGAEKVKAPVILQTTEPAINYLGIDNIVNIVKNNSERYKIPVALHLDHADNMNIIKKCIKHGYSSVMLDASENDIKNNIEKTKEVMEYAKEYNVTVESEIGIVDSISNKNENDKEVKKHNNMTDIEDAKYFIDKTNVDVLGISIGNIHGMRVKETEIDYKRLIEINNATKRPLVLHGSSGINDSNLKEIIKYGISKINIETELRIVFRKSLEQYLEENPSVIKPRDIMGYVRELISRAVILKFEALNTINKANNFLQ